MEGLALQFVPGPGLLAGGILLLVVFVAGILFVWNQDKQRRAAAKREPLKKAA